MRAGNIYTTTILLLPESENGKVKKWLKQNHFFTGEAKTVSQALEMIYDFTVNQSPDVILLDVNSFVEEFPPIRKMIAAASVDGKISMLALSGSKKTYFHKDCFQGTLEQIKMKLHKVTSKHARAVA